MARDHGRSHAAARVALHRRWTPGQGDGVTHGDDHFLPGPTDIAWDLAGIIVEWDLGDDARDHLLAEYKTQSGDDARERIDDYMLAYALFRLAYVKMAAGALRGSDEEPRLLREYQRYRGLLGGNACTRNSEV